MGQSEDGFVATIIIIIYVSYVVISIGFFSASAKQVLFVVSFVSLQNDRSWHPRIFVLMRLIKHYQVFIGVKLKDVLLRSKY